MGFIRRHCYHCLFFGAEPKASNLLINQKIKQKKKQKKTTNTRSLVETHFCPISEKRDDSADLFATSLVNLHLNVSLKRSDTSCGYSLVTVCASVKRTLLSQLAESLDFFACFATFKHLRLSFNCLLRILIL